MLSKSDSLMLKVVVILRFSFSSSSRSVFSVSISSLPSTALNIKTPIVMYTTQIKNKRRSLKALLDMPVIWLIGVTEHPFITGIVAMTISNLYCHRVVLKIHSYQHLKTLIRDECKDNGYNSDMCQYQK